MLPWSNFNFCAPDETSVQAAVRVAEVTVSTLRGLFRSYQNWLSDYEAYGIETITDAEGEDWNLFDVQYLLSNLHMLPRRQAEAILHFLVEGKSEPEVAAIMGIQPTNPVGLYATAGCERLIELIGNGGLPRFYIAKGA